jgi:replicative DNA helicase
VTTVPLPYEALQNTLNGGLRAGEVVIVASRPSIGKSIVALDICRHAALKGVRTVLVSLEMTAADISARLTAATARVPLSVTRRMVEFENVLSEEDRAKIAKVSDKIQTHGNNLRIITPSSSFTIRKLDSYLNDMRQSDTPAELVAIDYLQLLDSDGTTETRQVEVREISRAIKTLARKYGIPIVVVAQLNREPEHRSDKIPQLIDLGESSALEQDASVVILVHREDAYNDVSPRAGEADLIVAKNRNGWTSTVVVAFQGHYARMVDLAGYEPNP